MTWIGWPTISGGLPPGAYTYWGVALCLFACGCSSLSRNAFPGRDPAPQTSFVQTSSNQAAREAATQELGPETAASMPVVQSKPHLPADPIADALVSSMLNSLGKSVVGADGATHIGLRELRNQSRCSAAEYRAFGERLATILNNAAAGSRVKFTNDPDEIVQYEVQGTAYLITVEGIDAWELFLSMTPATESWSVWQSAGPVRVLRHARPGVPQFVQ